MSITLSEKTLNKRLSVCLQENNKNNQTQNNFLQKSKNNINLNVSKSPINKIKKGQDSISSFASISAKSILQKNKNQKKSIKITSIYNNLAITDISGVKKFNTSYSNTYYYLTKESTINLQIKSNYKNINDIAEGKYINNKRFQNDIQKIVKYYAKNNLKQKDKKIYNKFNYRKFLSDKNQINYNQDKLKEKKDIDMNEEYSANSKNKFLKIKNRFVYNNPNGIIVPLPKERHIIYPGDNITRIYSNDINKNNVILPDYIKFTEIKEPFPNYLKFKHVQTFQNRSDVESNMNLDKESKNKNSLRKLYAKNIINNKNGNNIQEVNLNYVNNFCNVY